MSRLSNTEITHICILRMPCGDILNPRFGTDPYWRESDWLEAARGDGRNYAGVEETVRRRDGETVKELLARAEARAEELNKQR